MVLGISLVLLCHLWPKLLLLRCLGHFIYLFLELCPKIMCLHVFFITIWLYMKNFRTTNAFGESCDSQLLVREIALTLTLGNAPYFLYFFAV